MRLIKTSFGLLACYAVLGSACGGHVPGASGTRESGQSKLMDNTFAGQNKCNPKNHERPFIIEWDATDMSSFESHAASDIVVVRYEGCELRVLDKCRNDSVRGALGSYRSVEWTSGSMEKLEITSEGELYAKLPLGVATLGGRVHGGEKFRMEYYVAGTRNATRDSVYLDDIKSLPGCEGATHFVYGFNLGAFALGSASETSVAAEGSLYGFGAGGSTKNTSKADKEGGDLKLCKSDSAKEIEGCKVPIRLTLREIQPGENPIKTAQKAPDTPESLNAAGQIAQKLDMSEEARAHYDSAMAKLGARDGKGCLDELDAHDKLDPKHKSSDPKSTIGHFRGQCLMLTGKCDAGKVLIRKSFEANQGANMAAERIDAVVEAFAAQNCQGANMSQRDQMLKALMALQMMAAGVNKVDKASCMSNYQAVRKLEKSVKPRDDEDSQIKNGPRNLYVIAPQCLARAGDCDAAWKVFQEAYPADIKARTPDAAVLEKIMKSNFETLVSKCKK